jgi:hypothetical protein
MFGLLDSGSEHKTFNKKLIRSSALVRPLARDPRSEPGDLLKVIERVHDP